MSTDFPEIGLWEFREDHLALPLVCYRECRRESICQGGGRGSDDDCAIVACVRAVGWVENVMETTFGIEGVTATRGNGQGATMGKIDCFTGSREFDFPWLAFRGVSEGCIFADVYQHMGHSTLLEEGGDLVGGIPLDDSVQGDGHAFFFEGNRVTCHLDLSEIDQREGL